MGKQTKSGPADAAISDMIFEEVGPVSVTPTLDHLTGADETRPVEMGDAFGPSDTPGEIHESTRLVRVAGKKQLEDMVYQTHSSARMQPLPKGTVVHLEDRYGKCFPVTKTLTIIGRVQQVADVVFSDDDLSRHHAALSFASGRFILEDLDSTNGTFVNGKRIKKVELTPGDELRFGSQVLKLVVSNA